MADDDTSAGLSAAERKLAELAKKKQQLIEQEKKLKAKLKAEKATAERKADTRRKILLGAFLLARLADPETAAKTRGVLRSALPGFLRPDDLPLFDDLLKADDTNGATPPADAPASTDPAPERRGMFGFGRTTED